MLMQMIDRSPRSQRQPGQKTQSPWALQTVLLVCAFLGSVFASTAFPEAAFAFGTDPKEAASAEAVNTSPLTATARLQPSTVESGGTAELLIDLKLADKYHAYLDKFKLVIDSPQDLKIDQFKLAPIVEFKDTFSGTMKSGIEKQATLRTVVEVPAGFANGDHAAKFKLTYQACTNEHCLFPKNIVLEVPFKVAASTGGSKGASLGPAVDRATSPAIAPSNSAGSSSGSEFQKALGKGTLFALMVVFGMGFLTSLTPCIYPMIPITLAVLGARTKGQSKFKSFTLSFTYVLGIALTYSLLGVVAASTGSLFGAALSNIYVVTGIALLFVTMGLSMYGLFEIQVPAFLRDKVGTAQTGSGYSGAFLTGLVAGVVASPCVGPVLVSVLTYIAQTQNLVLGFLFLFAFAMGMGVLFMVLGTSSALISKVPRAGAWMEVTKFIFGTVMVAMAIYYIQPLYPTWLFNTLVGVAAILIASAYGAFEANEKLEGAGRVRKGAMLAVFVIGLVFALSGLGSRAGLSLPGSGMIAAANGNEKAGGFEKLAWQPYNDATLAAALKSGQPVLIDFYADWCGACKELEKYTFTDPRIRDISTKFVLLKIDATESSPALEVLKQKYQVMGLPTMIFYDVTGKLRSDLTVTGFEEADKFLGRMNSSLVGADGTKTREISQASSGEAK